MKLSYNSSVPKGLLIFAGYAGPGAVNPMLLWLLQAPGPGADKGNSREAEEGRSTNEFTEDINTLLDVKPSFMLSADWVIHVVSTQNSVTDAMLICSYRTTNQSRWHLLK